METPNTNEQLAEMQRKITAALQAKVLSAVNNNSCFRLDLEAIRFSVEITERFSHIHESEQCISSMGRY